MRPWMWAALGGVGGAAATFGLLMLTKRPDLERRGEVLRRQLEGRERLGPYSLQMYRLSVDLGRYAETVANRAADEHLATVYGLSRERMQSMQALARRLGVE